MNRVSLIALFSLAGLPAFAADLPTHKAPLAPAPIAAPFSWTGAYAGVNLGGSWVNETQTFLSTTGFGLDPSGTKYTTDRSGFLGGVDLGYNYQIGQFVLGAEGDFELTRLKGVSNTASATPGFTVTSYGKTNWYATLTGRVGYALDKLLIYGKGGVAWSQQQYGGGISGLQTDSYQSLTSTRTGWTLGAGAEYAITRNIALFAEYDYLHFGKKTYVANDTAFGIQTTYSASPNVSIAKVGVNFHF